MPTSKEDSIKDILAANRNDYKRIARLLENGNVTVGGADKLEKEADRRAEQLILAREEDARADELEHVSYGTNDDDFDEQVYEAIYDKLYSTHDGLPLNKRIAKLQSQPTMKESK